MAGLQCFVILYFGGKINDCLNNVRYKKYLHMVTSNKTKLEPQKLLPTERAVHYHVHYQIRVGKTSDQCEHSLQWGWKKVNNELCQ